MTMATIALPTTDGTTALFSFSEPRDFPVRASRPFTRVAFSATHVVADPRAEVDRIKTRYACDW